MHAAGRNGEDPPGASASAAALAESRGADEWGATAAAPAAAQQTQVIRWERFLPRRSLRVLLVEHDDSTRHIVAALLRKCSYHVAAVADGLKAWEVLKQKEYKFDLVLTEVEMPSLSGIGLLSKIIGNEQAKNIPVIMMSSYDSVNVVFKCMLKGAVDFLVKPVRRNELKNLWQHVWRKHCSTSYTNRNESVNNNHTKSEELSGEIAASNNAVANNASRYKDREQCDQESETQNSGSKEETEIQSMQIKEEELIPNDDASSLVPIQANLDKEHDKLMLSKNGFKKYIAVGGEDNSARTGEQIISAICEPVLTEKSKKRSSCCATPACGQDIVILEGISARIGFPGSFSKVSPSFKAPEKSVDFIGGGSADCIPAVADKDLSLEENPCEHTQSFPMEKATSSDAPSSWDVSLRGSHINGCLKQGFHERHILKHSAASAFSRYCTGIRFSCQEDGSGQANTGVKTKEQCAEVQLRCNNYGTQSYKEEPVPVSSTLRLTSSHRNGREPSPHNEDDECSALNSSRKDAQVTHSSNDADKNIIFSPCQLGPVSHPFRVRVPLQNLCSGYGAILPPLFCPGISTYSSTSIEKAEDSRPPHLSQHGINQYDQFQQSNGNLRMHVLEHGNRGHLVDERLEEAGQFVFPGNQNATCDRSNLNGTHGDANGEMTDASAPPGIVPDLVNMNGFNNGSQDLNLSRREAALMKFRLKRKDRCFEKKVRYQNRKKLAEQRPRIKGQFVRQSTIESNAVTMEEDN